MQKRQQLSIAILLVVYLVGFIGIYFNIHEAFILLTPVNLCLSLFLVVWNHDFTVSNKSQNKLIWFLLLCFSIGFSVEVLGVQTGSIFGAYTYGPVLGWKLLDTPLMIGINWAMLTYCAGICMNHLMPNSSGIIKAMAGAGLMTSLDFFIEPVAVHYNFWRWENIEVPLQNYAAWFLIAFMLLLAFNQLIGFVKNKVAVILFILQFLFFAGLAALL